MNIICDHDFRLLVKDMPKYQMDLGRAYTKKDPVKHIVEENIKDEFVIKFMRETGRLIYKVGRIGPINFYTYDSLPLNEIWIYDGEIKHIEKFDKQLARIDFKKYFAGLIYKFKNYIYEIQFTDWFIDDLLVFFLRSRNCRNRKSDQCR